MYVYLQRLFLLSYETYYIGKVREEVREAEGRTGNHFGVIYNGTPKT